MGVEVFFSMSTGLSRDVVVPAGTVAACVARVEAVGAELGLVVRRRPAGEPGWWDEPRWGELDRDAACAAVEAHAAWVRGFHGDLRGWAAEPPGGEVEVMTPTDAGRFWHGLRAFDVPPRFWGEAHLAGRARMVRAVMTRGSCEGVHWPGGRGCARLTGRQADAVMALLSRDGLSVLVAPDGPTSREDHVNAMDDLYEALRGRGRGRGRGAWPAAPGEGPRATAAPPLEAGQAGAVVWLLAAIGYDEHDVRLAVPRGYDRLAAFDRNEYDWCETCGAVDPGDGEACARRGCALREARRRED